MRHYLLAFSTLLFGSSAVAQSVTGSGAPDDVAFWTSSSTISGSSTLKYTPTGGLVGSWGNFSSGYLLDFLNSDNSLGLSYTPHVVIGYDGVTHGNGFVSSTGVSGAINYTTDANEYLVLAGGLATDYDGHHGDVTFLSPQGRSAGWLLQAYNNMACPANTNCPTGDMMHLTYDGSFYIAGPLLTLGDNNEGDGTIAAASELVLDSGTGFVLTTHSLTVGLDDVDTQIFSAAGSLALVPDSGSNLLLTATNTEIQDQYGNVRAVLNPNSNGLLLYGKGGAASSAPALYLSGTGSTSFFDFTAAGHSATTKLAEFREDLYSGGEEAVKIYGQGVFTFPDSGAVQTETCANGVKTVDPIAPVINVASSGATCVVTISGTSFGSGGVNEDADFLFVISDNPGTAHKVTFTGSAALVPTVCSTTGLTHQGATARVHYSKAVGKFLFETCQDIL